MEKFKVLFFIFQTENEISDRAKFCVELGVRWGDAIASPYLFGYND